MTQPTRIGADLALSVFLAPLAAGRRVLWVGDGSPATERLAESAAELRALDPSELRDRLRVLAADDAEPFDVAVVPDVMVLPDPAAALPELAAALGDAGVLVAGACADRHEAQTLDALLGAAFREVRLVAQAPFGGFALADLTADEVAEVVVDGSLLGAQTEAVERVYGLASEALPSIDAYTLVQLAGASASTTAVDRPAPADEDQALQEALEARSREAAALRDALQRAEGRLSQVQSRLLATEGELAKARATAQAAGSPEAEDDVAQLEEILRDRGARLRELEAECARRALLVRDLTEELVEHCAGRRGAARAHPLDVAATETETELERDELRVRVLEQHEAIEALARENAELAGRARGLAARLAEALELRGVAEARARVADLELAQEREEQARLQTELAETREHLELAMLQARGSGAADEGSLAERIATLEASERRLSARVGELSGQLLAAQDLAAQATEERDRARAETLGLTAQVANLETRMEGLRLGYEMRIAMLGSEPPQPRSPTGTDEAIERQLRRVSAELEALRGETDGLRLRLADREAALEEAQRRAAGTALLDETDRLREEVAALRADNGELTLRLADLEEQRAREAARARDLAQALASRDALVMRLQVDLGEEERAHRLVEAQARRVEAENARLREAVVQASEAVDAREAAEREAERLRARVAELEDRCARAVEAQARVAALEVQLEEQQERLREATAAGQRERDGLVARFDEERAALQAQLDEARMRVETLEAAHAQTLETLREARKLLDGWRAAAEAEEAGEAGRSEITAVGIDAPPESGVEALERALADKDTLLRSLTAQLEERDDRIRALERRAAESGSIDDRDAEEMRQMLLELEERAARLQEELGHERAARAALEQERAARRPAPDAELERLRWELRDRESALEEALSKANGYERDVSSLRGVVAEARRTLEGLLGDATTAGDPATAERIGALLSLLGGF